MKVLDYCNLLQACEYLAFGWEPLSQNDERLLPEERWRPYLCRKRNMTYEQTFPIYTKLSRAKEQLTMLFEAGLSCYSDNVLISLPKLERNIADYPNIHIVLGLMFENSFPNATVEPPYIAIQDFSFLVENKYFDKISINVAELKRLYQRETTEEFETFRLFFDNDLYLCCQKNNEPPKRLKKQAFRQGANNYLILEYVMQNPNITIDKADIEKNTGVEFSYDSGISNKLQTTFKNIPEVKDAFFDVLSANRICFKNPVTSRDLLSNNKKRPI